MRRYILIPDSFKGTMSSTEICALMKTAILRQDPAAEVTAIPVADGGEGTVEAFVAAAGGEIRPAKVAGPYFEPMEAFYGVLAQPDTAVIEMAACAGLPLVGEKKDPRLTTTYGVGELMLTAARAGCKKIILGLGGSATNDGGCGAAAAAGIKFYDEEGRTFVPTGGTLEKIARVDMTGLDPSLKDIEIVAMCDIDNPLCGETGAAAVFGPQKGADAAMVKQLDAGLAHLAGLMETQTGRQDALLPGAGAAGGMGFGMRCFFGARLQMGIEAVLDAVGYDALAENADFVFTGEGKLDGQSLRGKVVIGVARRTRGKRPAVIAVVGDIGEEAQNAYAQGVTAVFSINRVAVPYSVAKTRAREDLLHTMEDVLRLIGAVRA